MSLSIEDYFQYHPPVTDERKQAHAAVNESALELAKKLALAAEAFDAFKDVLIKTCGDHHCLSHALRSVDSLNGLLIHGEYLFMIQQARMFANQGITIDELKKSREE